MKRSISKICFLVMVITIQTILVQAQSTEFTYQGKLTVSGAAANGTYEMQFSLYDALTGGTQQGTTITNTMVSVVNGVFTVQLDFSPATPFSTGADRWLEIAVRKMSDPPGYTTLAPRQQITSSPYSIKTLSAATADALSANCSMCVTDAQINGVAGSKVSGTVANATTAGNVSGIVAIANGGTGSSTQNFVDLTTAQTIAGAKSFSNTINLAATNATGTEGVIKQNGSRLIHTYGTSNFFAGKDAGNFTMTSTAENNTVIGVTALRNNTTGNNNTAIGSSALSQSTSGNSNTAIGSRALFYNSTGNDNTAIGESALCCNISGSNNIAVGRLAGLYVNSGNNIDIGSFGDLGDSDTIRIGDIQTRAFISGIRGTTTGQADAVNVVIDSSGQLGTISSSRRYKEDIADMGNASDRLMALRPVVFRYKQAYENGEKPVQFGLIAEEVAETFPELVVLNKEGQPETVKYQDLTPLMLNELQKERARADEQAKIIAEQQAQLDAMKAKLAALEARDQAREERLEKLERDQKQP